MHPDMQIQLILYIAVAIYCVVMLVDLVRKLVKKIKGGR
jgi:hypothetical protein